MDVQVIAHLLGFSKLGFKTGLKRGCGRYVPGPRPGRFRKNGGWYGPAILAGLVLAFVGPGLVAQQGLSPVTSGNLTKFTIPERDREGLLVWQLSGEHAKIRPDGKMDIEEMIVNTYRGSSIDWTLSTPRCILDRQSKEAVSEADVRISNEKMEITGKGFHWLANENRFIIRSRVQVILFDGITREKTL